MNSFSIKKLFLATAFVFTLQILQAQENLPAAYFEQAKNKAFIEKDFSTAKQLCKNALIAAPEFEEASIFLGRLYGWSHQYDSARAVLKKLVQKNLPNTEALLAAIDIAMWDSQFEEAKSLCELGLQVDSNSSDFLLRKAQINYALKDYLNASKAAQAVLRIDASNAAAKALSHDLENYVKQNSIALYYDYYRFGGSRKTNWKVGSLEYQRQTNLGPLLARLSYADRQYRSGWQYEVDAYPKLSKKVYTYVNAGLSGKGAVFPKFRSGFSVFTQLPKSWELEAGLRFLKFDNNVLVYTASASKYLGHYWLNARSFFTPGKNGNTGSYFLSGRYYYGKVNNYVMLGVGTGVSPDENRNIQLGMPGQLTTRRVSAGVNHNFHKNSVVFEAALSHDLDAAKQYSNQLNVHVGYSRRF